MVVQIKCYFRTLCLISIVILAACTTVPRASDSDAAMAKRALPLANKASVYVYRTKSFCGSALNMHVTSKERFIGTLENGTFLQIPVAGDKIELSLQSTVDRAGKSNFSKSVKPGDVVFAHVIYACTVFSMEPIRIKESSAETGKREIQDLQMVLSSGD